MALLSGSGYTGTMLVTSGDPGCILTPFMIQLRWTGGEEGPAFAQHVHGQSEDLGHWPIRGLQYHHDHDHLAGEVNPLPHSVNSPKSVYCGAAMRNVCKYSLGIHLQNELLDLTNNLKIGFSCGSGESGRTFRHLDHDNFLFIEEG